MTTSESGSGDPLAARATPVNFVGRSVKVITTFAVSAVPSCNGTSDRSRPSLTMDRSVHPGGDPPIRIRYFPGGTPYVVKLPEVSARPGGIRLKPASML